MDYRISPIAIEGYADADGVYTNAGGDWLGEVGYDRFGSRAVTPYIDEDGDYIPAPANWRDQIVEEL